MTDPARGVLIGCGFFARNHMHAWSDLAAARIVGVCDLDATKAAAFAADFGVPDHGTDAAAMLARLKPDFVDIATTAPSHRALVELSAGHARLVICQKPFAPTLADGMAMVQACAQAGVPLLAHENFRWQAPFRALKAAVDRQEIGQPRYLRLSFRHAFDIYATQPYLAEEPDLALTDVGLHLFDLARHLLGEVARVSCETQQRNAAIKGLDAFQATLRHHSGAVTSVECSFLSHRVPEPFPETLALLEGDLGTLELTQGYHLRLHRDGRVVDTDVQPPLPAWGQKPWHGVQESVLALQAHAIDVLAGRADPQPSGADNCRTLAVTMAAILAAKQGQTVDLAPFQTQAGG